jgi:hypothetical protein
MFRIGRSGMVLPTSAEVEDLRATFSRENYVRLPGLFDAQCVELVRDELSRATFYERVHKGLGPNLELCMHDNRGSAVLFMLLNNDRVFRVVEGITGCVQIRNFAGRMYRMVPGQGHADDWHDDVMDERLVALSINFSDAFYLGGSLQIRDRRPEGIVQTVPNLGHGDAILFRLAEHLEHRVSDVEGTAPKTAYAGWFRSNPPFLTLLQPPRTSS